MAEYKVFDIIRLVEKIYAGPEDTCNISITGYQNNRTKSDKAPKYLGGI